MSWVFKIEKHALAFLWAVGVFAASAAVAMAQSGVQWVDPDTLQPYQIGDPGLGANDGVQREDLAPNALDRLFGLQQDTETESLEEPHSDFDPFASETEELRLYLEEPETDPDAQSLEIEEARAPPAVDGPVPVIKIGVLAQDNYERLIDEYDAFRFYIEEHITPRRAELVILPDYRSLVRALTSGDVHLSQITSSAFADAYYQCKCLSPLVAPQTPSGNDGFAVIAVTRPFEDSSVLAQSKGIRIGLSSKSSLAGYILPVDYLRRQGVDVTAALGSNKLMTAASPADAFMLVKGNQADIAFGWSSTGGETEMGTFAQLSRNNRATASDFKVLWRSDKVPFSPFVSHATVPIDVQKVLRQALLDLYTLKPELYARIEPYYGGGYKSTEIADYAIMTNLYEAAGRN